MYSSTYTCIVTNRIICKKRRPREATVSPSTLPNDENGELGLMRGSDGAKLQYIPYQKYLEGMDMYESVLIYEIYGEAITTLVGHKFGHAVREGGWGLTVRGDGRPNLQWRSKGE